MITKKINSLIWFGSAFTATIVLCFFSMVATFFIKTDGTVLGTLFWQIAFGISYTPIIFVCSIPLIWLTWRLVKNHKLSRIMTGGAVGVCAVWLIAVANLPYFLSPHLLSVPYDLLIVTAGVALNIAAFLWLSSPAKLSLKWDA